MNGKVAVRQGRPEWLVCTAKAGVVFLALFVLVHLAQQQLALLAAVLVLLVITIMGLAVVVPPLFLLGFWAESTARKLGVHLPDPMRLRAAYRAKFVAPLLCSET
jgi:hypothetical protein